MSYPVLDLVSQAYPRVQGRLPTCYSPVRRSCTPKGLTARLACVKHAASVRPEPGSNSPTKPGKTNETTTRGAVASYIWHKPSNQKNKARHTVEFSKDTRTPSTTARWPPGHSHYGTPRGRRTSPGPCGLVSSLRELTLGLRTQSRSVVLLAVATWTKLHPASREFKPGGTFFVSPGQDPCPAPNCPGPRAGPPSPTTRVRCNGESIRVVPPGP